MLAVHEAVGDDGHIEKAKIMTFPGQHGFYKADDAMRPKGGDGREHANSEALRAERDRVHDERLDHPGRLTRLVRRIRRRR